MDRINDAFKPLFGQPSWSVERGRESALFSNRPAMVFLEFGDPVLTINQPRNWPVHIEGAPVETPGRITFVRGQWLLTLMTGCAWELMLDNSPLATSSSDSSLVDRALDVLDGQAIVAVDIDSRDASTVFTFDLGCVLTTHPNLNDDDGDPIEQWGLAVAATASYLCVRSDGKYKIRRRSDRGSRIEWIPIA